MNEQRIERILRKKNAEILQLTRKLEESDAPRLIQQIDHQRSVLEQKQDSMEKMLSDHQAMRQVIDALNQLNDGLTRTLAELSETSISKFAYEEMVVKTNQEAEELKAQIYDLRQQITNLNGVVREVNPEKANRRLAAKAQELAEVTRQRDELNLAVSKQNDLLKKVNIALPALADENAWLRGLIDPAVLQAEIDRRKALVEKARQQANLIQTPGGN